MIGGLLLHWLALLLCLASCNHLFYAPTRVVYTTPTKLNKPFQELTVPVGKGDKLAVWRLFATEPRYGTILQFHGNGENMTSHFLFVEWLTDLGFDVVTFDYRGYGRSTGVASRAATIEDGLEVIRWLKADARSAPMPLFVVGQSLGGAVSVASVTAAQRESLSVAALVLDSTFDSYRAVTRNKLGGFWLTWPLQWPLSFLVSDELSPAEMAPALTIPILQVHAVIDPIVPYARGIALHELFTQDDARMIDIPVPSHTRAFTKYSPLRPDIVGFFCRHSLEKEACDRRLAPWKESFLQALRAAESKRDAAKRQDAEHGAKKN
jgi:pimeloyl-ACP methyl ester carboxylesterase